MKTKLLLVAAFFGAVTISNAQVTVPVTNATFQAGFFATAFNPGQLVGELTSIDVNVTLTNSVESTYGNDFTILVGTGLGATDTFALQAGGYSDIEADERIEWTTGGSEAVGTVCSETVTLATPINFAFSPALKVYFGNGYFFTGAAGTWNGSFTLNGVSLAPLATATFDAAAFSVFPNPATDVVKVSNQNAKITSIALTDLNGRTVKQASYDDLSSVEINIADLQAGVYMMNITSAEGQATKKIVKK